MNSNLLQEAVRLPISERVDLVEAIWDTIAAETDAVSPTAEQLALVDARLADHLNAPESGIEWSALKEQLKARQR